MNKHLGWMGAGAMLLMTQGSALAGEFNYKALLTGEKAAGLGGAYVALADEQTGMYYNPAGIVHAPVLGSTATVNLLTGTSTTYDNVFGSTKWTRESLELVPGFFGTMVREGDMTLGVSVVVVDSAAENQTENYEDVVLSNTSFDELRIHNNFNARRYNIGPSIAMNAGGGWSWGVSLYADYATQDRSYLQRLARDSDGSGPDADDTVLLVQVERESSSLGVRPVLGVMYRGQQWSVGAALAHTVALTREYDYAFTGSLTNRTGAESNQVSQGEFSAFDLIDESDETEEQPFELALAVAYLSSTNTTWTVQLDYVSERELSRSEQLIQGGGVPPRDLSTDAVLNFALGVERPLTSNWLMRAGAYTNFANNQVTDIVRFEDPNNANQTLPVPQRREEIDMYGLTFSLTRVDAVKARHWTLGVQMEAGSGEATLGDVGFGSSVGQTVDAESYKYNVFLSVNM